MRLAVSGDMDGSWPGDPEIRRNTLDAAAALREAGAIVDEVALDVPNELVMRAAALRYRLGFGAMIAAEAAAHPELITAYAEAFGREMTVAAGDGAQMEKFEIEARIYAPVGALLETYDALLCPTVGGSEEK